MLTTVVLLISGGDNCTLQVGSKTIVAEDGEDRVIGLLDNEWPHSSSHLWLLLATGQRFDDNGPRLLRIPMIFQSTNDIMIR